LSKIGQLEHQKGKMAIYSGTLNFIIKKIMSYDFLKRKDILGMMANACNPSY
jgi:hypothetical protein